MSLRFLAVCYFATATSCTPPAPKCPEPAPPPSALATKATPAASDAPAATEKKTPAPSERTLVLTAATVEDLPGWSSGTQGEALVALGRSCAKLKRYRDERWVGRRTRLAGKVRDWRPACAALTKINRQDHVAARAYLKAHFHVFAAANNDDPVGRFTGYYEERLAGSKKQTKRYSTPLYRRPKDLVMVDLRDFVKDPVRRRISGRVNKRGRLKPYFNRAQIDAGALKGRGLELVWVDDKISAFFTEVQGSGLVAFEDGTTMRVGYAGQNGHIYTAIGREMIADGILTRKTVSMQSIRKWLEDNPDKADDMMQRNESVVFFEKLAGKRNGPLGSQGVELTAGRSLAIDRVFIAQSIPIWIDSFAPVPFEDREQTWRRLVVAQDTGGAIRGPVRGDIFWGSSREAADVAGRTKSTGTYYLFIPKTVAVTPGPQPKGL